MEDGGKNAVRCGREVMLTGDVVGAKVDFKVPDPACACHTDEATQPERNNQPGTLFSGYLDVPKIPRRPEEDQDIGEAVCGSSDNEEYLLVNAVLVAEI